MPIGIVDDIEFQKELESLSGTPKKKESHPEIEIEDIPKRGRSEGDVNVPDSLRKVIAEDALLNGRSSALSLAKEFGVSPSSVSAYAKGATSTTSYNNPSSSIIQHINKSRERAVKRAQKTLNGALGAITQEKLDYADPKDLASIAKDMTVVIKNLEPPKESVESVSNSPQFVIFAPQFREEKTFEVINVAE